MFYFKFLFSFADLVGAAYSTAHNWLFAGSSSASAEAGPSHHLPVAGADRRAGERVGGASQPHRSCIVVHIYAFLETDIQAVIKDIEDIIRDYLQDKVIDGKEDQKIIAQLTDNQV